MPCLKIKIIAHNSPNYKLIKIRPTFQSGLMSLPRRKRSFYPPTSSMTVNYFDKNDTAVFLRNKSAFK